MCDFQNLTQLNPCLIEDIECIRSVQTYTIKKRQFLQSTGEHTIEEIDGFLIRKVVVSGFTHMKDITPYMINLFGQTDCPLAKIVIDTGKFNEYTQGDIECGTRTILQIDYMFDDKNIEEKKLKRTEVDDQHMSRVYDPTDCTNPTPAYVETGHSLVYLINKGKCCIPTSN